MVMIVGVFLSLVTIKGVWGGQSEQLQYKGADACRSCHEGIYTGWKGTRHARAYETLKKKSQETLPACQRCHVTGYDKAGGYIDQELTPDLAGVQCESCHGAGSLHVSDPANKKGLIGKPGEGICRECHTKGQDPKFDYQHKIQLVHGSAQEVKEKIKE
jgi:hypothetical protein